MKKKVYEDQVHAIYEGEKENEQIIELKNDIVNSSGHKRGTAKNKGQANAHCAAHLYRLLESYQIANNFKKMNASNKLTVEKVEWIPFEVSITNYSDGNKLKGPKIGYVLKQEEGDKIIRGKDILKENFVSQAELHEIRRQSLKINVILQDFFDRRDLTLTYLLLQFGHIGERMGIADTITFDTCYLEEKEGRRKYDPDNMSRNAKQAEELYEDLKNRIILS